MFCRGKICLHVDVDRIEAFVAQPQGDGGGIASCVKEVHCRCVTKHMGRDLLLLE